MSTLAPPPSAHGRYSEPPPEPPFVAADPQGKDPVVRAIARRKGLVAAIAVLIAAAGVAAGAARKPTYTASTTLQVGTVNPNSPGFFGFVQSAADLATAFSRSIAAAPVLETVHDKLGLNASQATARLSAAPIPVSPSFRIVATGPSARAAIDLANVTSAAVVSYESHANSSNPRAEELLERYHEAAQALQKAAAKVDHLSAASHTSASASLLRAKAARDEAQVHANALSAAYQNALVTSGPSDGLVSLLAGATTASNDHRSKTELFGFIGLLAGLVLGSLAAVLVEQRRRPRLSH